MQHNHGMEQLGPRGCGARGRNGQLCGAPAIAGTTRCRMHAGKSAAKAKAQGAVVLAVRAFGLDTPGVDPGETLLKLVAQSAARAELYGAEVRRIVDEHDGSLEKALTASSYTVTESGEPVKTGEYIRAMTRLEAEERDRCATMATKAIAAGLAERQVRLAERQAALMADVLAKVLDELGLDPAKQQEARRLVAGNLRVLAG